VKYNDTVYVYNDKYFELTTEILPKKIALLTPEYKSSDLKEVTTRFLQLEMPENITDMTLKERYVAFKDKVIGSNGQMMSHTPTVFASHYIDAVLDLTATHKKTEEFFEELLVKNSDKEQLLNFWEHMGCVIWDKSDWGKSNGILKGPTGSLKSHILFAISNAIGERNCAHIRMTDFATNNDFKMANTIGKLLNSSEEIPRKKISDDVMTVLKEYIGSQLPKTIRPIWGIPINVVCEFKHLYATNVFPGLETTAEDVMIRFCL
jgi:phage/plasmid-associated DNA primase